MSTTERLRQLLDKRGVRWEEPDPYQDATAWVGSNNIEYVAHEGISFDGPTGRLILFCLTPEQVVEATLGRGTCHDANVGGYFVCSECEALVKLYSIGRSYVDEWGKRWYATSNDHGFNFCPNCGRMVEK